MKLSDEEWLSRARARAQVAGVYEPEPLEPLPPILRRATEESPPPAPRCPYCKDRPDLAVYPRYELVTLEPLRYCPQCYGFWACKDSLARGVHDPYDRHPALTAAPAPGRCRLCFGRLKEDGTCRDCGAPVALLSCPSCNSPMERVDQEGVTVDRCAACHGVWFDMGEIARAYKLTPVQGLAASAVDETADDEAPPAWQIAADVLLRVFLPFLPF